MAAPPDLRVLCRRLASTPADDLPTLCPLLVNHVLRCGSPLSSSQDAKGKDKTSETPMLVHKLKTHITTLLTGKSPPGRFAAVCLVKAVIDVGGWETLRASDPWIRGLIGLLQKPEPLSSKELCIVTLTKIYMLLHGYQTLVREMATPTLPSYVTACLQLIKPPASGRPLKVPAAFVDTVACSLSKLVVLYPTTLRPFATQIKAALRAYIAPTSSEPLLVPHSLRESSRRLFILLSHTAPKNGSSEEWAKAIRSAILDCHATVDQVFRAVVESWESSTGYRSQQVRIGVDPSGGGDSAEELPPWTGVQAGAERLVGLLEYLAEFLNNETKSPVTVPLGELLDLTARITLVTPPSPASEDSIETNPAIGRDEKAELWSVLPDIHIAVLRLHRALIRRLRENALPLATDILDQMVRVFNASRHIPSLRETSYILAKQLLNLCGPTLPKLSVDSLTPLIHASCQDMLLATGHLEAKPPQEPPSTNGTKQQQQQQQQQKPTTTNADAFLTNPTTTTTSTTKKPTPFPALPPSLTDSATSLLPTLLSHLPQSHLAPETRGLLDRTAILARDKAAMVASVLHPYRDSRGRYYASILPFLARQFPREQELEVLRCHLVRARGGAGAGAGAGSGVVITLGWDPREEGLGELVMGFESRDDAEEGGGKDEVEERGEAQAVVVVEEGRTGGGENAAGARGGWTAMMEVDDPAVPESVNPFARVTSEVNLKQEEVPAPPPSRLKRKSEELEAGNPPKRVDTGKPTQQQVATVPTAMPLEAKEDDESGSNSDSEGSVQIDMTLDDDEKDDEEEDE
ncbi:hypothetical protein VTK56DRAFT_9277 [Thermocarpiscus australiensis]